MKPLLILLTVFSSFFASAKAPANPYSEAARQSFNAAFGTASEVVWSYANNLYKASFILNGQHATAFYDEAGNFMGVTRNISSLQLPLTLQAALKKDYKAMWISELFEMTTEDGVHYYVTVEDGDTKLILKSANSSVWSAYQKLRKS